MRAEDFPVLFLTQAYPDTPDAYRGIFVKNLAARLTSKKYRVVVVTPRIGTTSKKHELSNHIEVFRFYFPSNEPLIAYRRLPIFRMLVYMPSCLARSFYIMRTRKCRLVHVHWIHPNGVIGVAVKALFRVPMVVHVRGSDFHTYGTKNPFFTRLTRFVLSHADWIFCTSGEMKKGILKTFPNLKRDKITVVYNDIDASRFRPIPEGEAREALEIPGEGIHLLFVGNLVRDKGVVELVAVAADLFETGKGGIACLHLVGAGPLFEELEALVSEKGLKERIFLHGAVPPRRIPLWLNASNLLILPSAREGMPNVVLEALACGIPVLATDVGDVGEFVTGGENGFLLKTDDMGEELRRVLEDLLSEPERLAAMKVKLQRGVAGRFPLECGSDEVMRVYALLAGKRR